MSKATADHQEPTIDTGPAQVVSVRFAPQELARLRSVADAEGVPLSTIVRRAVLAPSSTGLFVTAGSASSTRAGVSLSGAFTPGSGTVVDSKGPTSEDLNVGRAYPTAFTVR